MDAWQFKILYDGKCPLCSAEMEWLFRRDRKGLLLKEDITAPEFDPGRYGKSLDELMGSIHGVFPDGRIIFGIYALAELYRILGLGWIWWPSKLPLLRSLYSFLYRCFARHRLGLGKLFRKKCDDGRCRIDSF